MKITHYYQNTTKSSIEHESRKVELYLLTKWVELRKTRPDP